MNIVQFPQSNQIPLKQRDRTRESLGKAIIQLKKQFGSAVASQLAAISNDRFRRRITVYDVDMDFRLDARTTALILHELRSSEYGRSCPDPTKRVRDHSEGLLVSQNQVIEWKIRPGKTADQRPIKRMNLHLLLPSA